LLEYGDRFVFSSFQDVLGQPSESATCIIEGHNNAAKKKKKKGKGKGKGKKGKGKGKGNEKEQNEM
jgi:hypothetical protein